MGSGLVVVSELCIHHWGLQRTQGEDHILTGEIPKIYAGAQLLATLVPAAMAMLASWDSLSEDSCSGDIQLAQLTPFLDLGCVYQESSQHRPCVG